MPKNLPYIVLACCAGSVSVGACNSGTDDKAEPTAVTDTASAIASRNQIESPVPTISNQKGDHVTDSMEGLPAANKLSESKPKIDDNKMRAEVPGNVTKTILDTLPEVATAPAANVRPASFNQCMVCHSDKKGQRSGFGPNLFGVAGSQAGSVPGYAYSPAITASGIQWTSQNLDQFLQAPQSKIPGSKMAFSGIKDATARKEIVAYIISLK